MYGNATIEELEEAGAFENLKVFPEKISGHAVKNIAEEREEKIPFHEKHSTLLFSTLLIVLGYISQFVNGEENLVTVLLFLSAIIISGFTLFKVGLQNLLIT